MEGGGKRRRWCGYESGIEWKRESGTSEEWKAIGTGRWKRGVVGVFHSIYKLDYQIVSRVSLMVAYFAHPPDSPPRPAPILGWPTPSLLPVHEISKGNLMPR